MRMIGGNSTFAFGIVIRSQESRGFHREGEIPDLNLSPDGIKLKLKVIKKSPEDREGFDKLILKSGGFPSEKEAKQYGTKIRDSIYLSGLLSKNPYKIISFTVFEEDGMSFRWQANLSSPILLSSFGETINKAINLIDKLDNKQLLVLELYNISHYENTQRAGYISLFTAVEIFAESGGRELLETREKYLKELLNTINKSSLIKDDKNFFKGYLCNLRKESNKEACKRLIKENLGTEHAEIFESHQPIRNKLLHDGEIPDNFKEKLEELRAIVSSLLPKILNISNQNV